MGPTRGSASKHVRAPLAYAALRGKQNPSKALWFLCNTRLILRACG